MAKIKNINTRIQLKNDTENNWNKAKAEEGKDGFIPLLGEAIIYMGENGRGPRIKIGDGETNVVDLPFLEDNDTVYTASDGIKITAENVIQHINHLDAFPSEIGFYKIKYDGQGHINGATAVSKQDILDLLQITPGRIDSVQITATAPLTSSNSNINTTNLTTNISFSSQEKNKVFAGPTQSASGSPSFRLLIADDIPNLSASKITEGTFSASRIGNLPASKITSGTFNKNRIPNLGPSKISGVIPVSKGGTGVNGISGDPENNVTSFFDNGVFVYDSGNARFKQFRITTLGNTDTFTSYINSLNGDTANRIVDLDTLISAVPPMNLNNPRDIAENYINSYYAPKTKGWKNSVLISQGGENLNEGIEPVWLNPTVLSTEEHPGGALFYGRDNSSESSPKPFKTQWGTLPVEQGGTGTTTFIADYVLIGSGKNAIRTIAKAYSSTPNTIVERNSNGDFATRAITLSKGLLCNGINNNFLDNLIIDIDSSTKIATFYGNINANNLNAVIGELNMSKTNSETLDQPSIKWYKGSSTKSESAIISQTSTLIGELYWDNNKANRGMLRNYYSSTNGEIHSDSYYLPAVNTSSANNNEFTFLATADSISGMFPTNSILYSNGNVNKITYKNSANGALYSTGDNQDLEWGTLPVAQGGTGLSTIAANSVLVGNSIETDKTRKIETITTKNGAFYATGNNLTPQFGILPVAQGGTGVASIENIQAGKDGNGNTISSTYLKLSGGTMTGNLVAKKITIEHTSGEQQEYRVTYGSTVDMSFMIGTSNENHGIYDSKASKWMIYADASGNVTVNGNAATATKAIQDGSGNTITSKYVTIDTAQTITGTKSWGTSGAGGQLNGAATNGGINSIRVGDDVWLGDCDAGGIMGMKSTGANCGFFMYNSSGTQIGQLYFNGTNLYCNKTIEHPDGSTSYIAGAKGSSAALYAKKEYNVDHWYPAVVLETKGGGSWQIGNYNNERLQFAYATKANRDSNTNEVSILYAESGDTGRIMTSDNYTNWTVTKTGSGASGTWGINISGNAATATKATQDGSGNTITSKYVTVDTDQLSITGQKRFTKAVQCYRFTTNNNLPAITMDKPGTHYIGIGADGTINRIHFGPCTGLDGSAWVDTGTFNSNEWYFQGNITCTNNIKTASGCRIGESGGALYLGNSGNQSWVYVQDICSQDSQKWKIHTNGNAEFNGTVTALTFSGTGIILSDDGDIVDLNNGYCSMRFSSGVDIYSGKSGGSTALRLSSNGSITSYRGTGDTGSNENGCVLKVGANNWGNTGIFNGNGDAGGSGTANLIIKSWHGVGFVDGCSGNGMRASVNCRTGEINCFRVTANLGESERRVGVDQGTAGTLYLFSNPNGKGLYSSTGYATGHVIRINNSGITYYGTVSSSSSKEVKTNIQYLNNTDYIDKLKPVSFIYKKDEKKKTHFGLIYEDTIDILPNICTIPEEEDEPKGINYIELVPVLLKEIQNLRKRIKLLENNT